MYQPCSWRHLNCTHFECLLYLGVSTNELIQACLIRKSSKLWSTGVAPGTGFGNTDVSIFSNLACLWISSHLCWCRTSSSMLRRSRGLLEFWRLEGEHIVGLRDPRLPLENEVGGHTCRARPLILFNPSRPFARVFFLSCCLNAFSPT